MLPERPLSVMIAALGGEGGGVLADWLVHAATSADFPVQSTSIPGVAQRTGATSYYLELYPATFTELGQRLPVMALTPNLGNVDLVVASELLEAGRVMQNGFVSPERTVLIASTHRVYAMTEKSSMTDGRYESERVMRAARALARRAILADMADLARRSDSALNAVLFGVICGSGALPLSRDICRDAIEQGAKAVESNLRGFDMGLALASGLADMAPQSAGNDASIAPAVERVRRDFPTPTQAILEHGVDRLVDYQDAAYADTYLDRLARLVPFDTGNYRLVSEAGRHLALWMSYEDVIRVAQLKAKPSRIRRVIAEVGASVDQPVTIVDYLKPGIEEFCSLLPAWLGRPIVRLARARGWSERFGVPLKIKANSISGFVLLRGLAGLKAWRRHSLRFAEERTAIDNWLTEIQRWAPLDPAFALEIVECARLIKGYGDTHRRGMNNFRRIFAALVEGADRPDVGALRQARLAALADPDGVGLARVLTELARTADEPVPAPVERRAMAGE